MSEIQFLKPFTRFCMTIGNLPSSYLISMTYEEQLLWLCDYLEKTVIPTINNNSEVTKEIQELFNQLKNYVEHYFDNLDLQEEINNKLDEMAQDGTLEVLLKNRDYPQFSNLQAHRIGRYILETGYINSSYLNQPYYATQQAICLLDDNTIISAFTPSNGSFVNSNNIELKKINLNNGQILSSNILPCGHANGMCYDGSYIYVTECFKKSNNGDYIYTNIVYKIDPINLSIVDTINIKGLENLSSNNLLLNFEYDKITKKYYAMQNNSVNELNENFEVINSINLDVSNIPDKGIYQVIRAYNNYFYLTNAYPNIICVFDKNGNNLQNYNLNDYLDDSYFIGELEDIDFNSKGYIIGASGKPLCESSDCNVSQYFKINFIKNQPILDTNKKIPNYRFTVNTSNTFCWNPNGSSLKPFNELAEAIEYSLSPKGKNTVYINMLKGSYKWSFICGASNLRINGNGSTISGITSFYSKVQLENFNIIKVCNSDLANSPLFISYSNVKLSNVSFATDNIDYTTLIEVYFSDLHLYNSLPNNLSDNIAFIKCGQLCNINYRGEIKNIIPSGNFTNYGNYPITDNIELQQGEIPLNSFMVANNIKLNDLLYVNKYIYFEFKDLNNNKYLEKYKMQNSNNTNFKINTVENSQEGKTWVNQMNIVFSNNKLNITINRSVKSDETIEEVPHLTLTKVYVSQY